MKLGTEIRPLTELDRFFFTNSFAPLSLLFSHDGCFDSSTVEAAWKQTVAKTPLMRMKVDGDGDNAVHVPITDEDFWPKIDFEKVDTDELVVVESHKKLDKAVTLILLDATKQRLPGFVAYVAGPARGAFVFVNPHHFIDGVGYGSLATKLMLYCKTPRALWSPLDMLSSDDVPSFRAMALKEHVCMEDPPIEPLSARIDPSNFSFQTYNPFAPLPDQPCLSGFEGDFPRIESKRMTQVRGALHAQGASISTAFTALAVKTLAMLIRDHYDILPEGKLVTVLPCDARRAFHVQKYTQLKLPVVANYAFVVHNQFDISQTYQADLSSLMSTIKQRLTEVTHDPSLLRKEILGQYCTAPLPIYVGVSSILMESKIDSLLGLNNVNLHSRIVYGPIPRVWFYVLTSCGQTTIGADIMLPIPGLTAEKVQETIIAASHNTCLEDLFQSSASNVE